MIFVSNQRPYLDRWMYTLIPLVNKNATYKKGILWRQIELNQPIRS